MKEVVFDIRSATIADAEAIAEIHGRSFLAAYPDLARTVAAINQGMSRRVALWTERIERQPAGCSTFVANEDLRIHGFIHVGPSRDDDDQRGDTGQIFSIHVDPPRWRSGLGKRLLDHGLDFLRSSGFSEATLWVVSGNSRARQFYEALGWGLDGGQRNEILAVDGPDGDKVDVVRYRLELKPREDL